MSVFYDSSRSLDSNAVTGKEPNNTHTRMCTRLHYRRGAQHLGDLNLFQWAVGLPALCSGERPTPPRTSTVRTSLKRLPRRKGRQCSAHNVPRDQETHGEFSLSREGGPGRLRTPKDYERPKLGITGGQRERTNLAKGKISIFCLFSSKAYPS